MIFALSAGLYSNSRSEFKMMKFDSSIVKKLQNVEGDLQYGYSWRDKGGINHLLFTRAAKFVQWEGEEKGMGDNYAVLRVYHFAGADGNFKLVRMVEDGNKEGCSNPPFALEAGFIKGSITVTDLDKNGYGEVTFIYTILCASELEPVPSRLVVMEKGEIYSISGTSYLAEFNAGGEKSTDDAFKNLDKKIQNHADKTWDRFVKPKKKEKRKSIKGDKNARELFNKQFFGTEPFWSMRFTRDGVYYTPNIGEEEISFSYANIKAKSGIWEIRAFNDSTGSEIDITVKKEKCSDGMSDNTYPYSINIVTSEDIRNGCGRNTR